MPKRYHTIFNLLALSIIIYIGVDTFYTVVRARLRQDDTRTVVVKHQPNRRRVQQKPSFNHYQAIMGRNLFGSTDAIVQEVKVQDIMQQAPEIIDLETDRMKTIMKKFQEIH